MHYIYYLIDINYVLAVDPQITEATRQSRVRLINETDLNIPNRGNISANLTLMQNQQVCINTTAILQVLITHIFYFKCNY